MGLRPFALAKSDYTKHNDTYRQELYIDRHLKNEDLSKPGVKTAGLYSKHVLWNKPTLQASIADAHKIIKSLNSKCKLNGNLHT